MSLTFEANPLFLFLLLVVAGAASYWYYQKTIPQLSGRKRKVLAVLRFFTLSIILFLLFEPILTRFVRDEQPAVLAILVDNSESLTFASTTTDSSDVSPRNPVVDVIEALARPSDQIERQIYLFDGNTVRMDDGLSDPSALSFSGERTDIAQALQFVAEDNKETNLGAVLLISDGQYNTGQNPLYVADLYPVPVFTAVVGDTTEQRDVQIRRIITNEIAYVGSEQPVQIGIRTTSFPGERVTVSLMSSGQILDTKTVALPEGSAEIPVDLQYTPENAGLNQMGVSVSRLPGETTHLNNEETFSVRVMERKRSILLVANAPSPDLSSLHQLLTADPSFEVESFTQKSAQTFYEGPFPSDLNDYDILLLAGFPGRYAHASAIQQIVQAAENGKPLMFIKSRQTDLNALKSYFAGVLPSTPAAVRPGFSEVVFVPTQAGMQHPLLDIEDAAFFSWSNLPPLVYNLSRWDVQPDAHILATSEIRGVTLNDPLLVIQSRIGRRSVSLLGEGTWRWSNLPEDLEALSPVWPTLLSNLIQWLGASSDFRSVNVETTTDEFGGEDNVEFVGQVYDESMNTIDDALVEVVVTAPDGNRFPYQLESLGSGRYYQDIGTLPEGTYRYSASAKRDEYELGMDEGAFAVRQLSLEYRETRADVTLMRQIAQRSGGRHFSSENLGSLSEEVSTSRFFEPLVIDLNFENKLWQKYLFLLLLIVLLSVEWFLRKRSGMV